MKYRINIIDDEKNINDLVRAYLEKEDFIVYSFYKYVLQYLYKKLEQIIHFIYNQGKILLRCKI